MSRGNQIDIVCPFALQFEHPGRKVVHAHFAAHPKLADRIVLAKDTLQSATGKKYRPGAARSGDRGFFPVMQIYRGDFGKIPNPAIP